MKKIRLKALPFIILLVIAAAVVYQFVQFIIIMGSLAENEIIKEELSPDGNFVAIAFIRDAGATTDYSAQVSVIKSGESLGNKAGNVFRGSGSEFIDFQWNDDNSLIIFHTDTRIYKQKQKIFNYPVIYRLVE